MSYLTSLSIKPREDHLDAINVQAIVSVALSLVILLDQIFYPDVPKSTPSLSQWIILGSKQQLNACRRQTQTYFACNELSRLFANFNFHFFCLLAAASQGLMLGWIRSLETIIEPGALGTVGVAVFAACIISAVGFGVIGDYLQRESCKPIIVALTVLSGLFLTIFVMIADAEALGIRVNAHDQGDMVYGLVCCVIGVACCVATVGMCYEEAVNLLYPSQVHEILSATVLTAYISVVSCTFVIANEMFDSEYSGIVVSCAQIICGVLLSFYQPKRDRLELDRNLNSFVTASANR